MSIELISRHSLQTVSDISPAFSLSLSLGEPESAMHLGRKIKQGTYGIYICAAAGAAWINYWAGLYLKHYE